jgi:hypothetical protein
MIEGYKPEYKLWKGMVCMTRTFDNLENAVIFMENCFYDCELQYADHKWIVIVNR